MKLIASALVLASLVVAACGGETANRAEKDVKGAGQDISNGVGTNGKGIENGVGVTNPDGGGNSTDKK